MAALSCVPRRDTEGMSAFAPRISQRLLEALVRLDDRTLPIAEVNRRVGEEAERLGLRRPSYQRIRVLLHASRRFRQRRPSTASVLLEGRGASPPARSLLGSHLRRRGATAAVTPAESK